MPSQDQRITHKRVVRCLVMAGESLFLLAFGVLSLACCILIGPDPTAATDRAAPVEPTAAVSPAVVILSQSPVLRSRGSIIGHIEVVIDTPNATRDAVDAALRAKAAALGAHEVIGIRYQRRTIGAPDHWSLTGKGQAVVWTRW